MLGEFSEIIHLKYLQQNVQHRISAHWCNLVMIKIYRVAGEISRHKNKTAAQSSICLFLGKHNNQSLDSKAGIPEKIFNEGIGLEKQNLDN